MSPYKNLYVFFKRWIFIANFFSFLFLLIDNKYKFYLPKSYIKFGKLSTTWWSAFLTFYWTSTKMSTKYDILCECFLFLFFFFPDIYFSKGWNLHVKTIINLYFICFSEIRIRRKDTSTHDYEKLSLTRKTFHYL